MAQGLSTPDPSLSPTHLSIRRGRATNTHYTHHQVSLMVLRNTTLVPSLGLRIGPACEASLSAGMRREHVPPRIRKKERKKERNTIQVIAHSTAEILLFPAWKNKRPPHWNSTSGFDFDHIIAFGMSFCTSLRNFIQIGPPTAEK